MKLLPEHSLGLINIWWYPLFYGFISFLVMSKISKDKKKRILTFPKHKDSRDRLISGFSTFAFGKGLIIYSIFIPIKSFTVYFYVGTIVYIMGLSLSIYSMWIFSKSDLSEPVTDGIYKISRHPMQVMNFIMWIGIAIVSQAWILVIYVALFVIISYPSFKAQERYCIEQYGDKYCKYMNKTPRYLLF